MKKISATNKHRMIKIAVTFFTVIIFSTLFLFIPLRNGYSDYESRSTEKFPEFSISSVMSGEYFSEIELWFSDSVPLRDTFAKTDSLMSWLSGVRSPEISVPEAAG